MTMTSMLMMMTGYRWWWYWWWWCWWRWWHEDIDDDDDEIESDNGDTLTLIHSFTHSWLTHSLTHNSLAHSDVSHNDGAPLHQQWTFLRQLVFGCLSNWMEGMVANRALDDYLVGRFLVMQRASIPTETHQRATIVAALSSVLPLVAEIWHITS